jgi:predicted transcriptional regulator
MGLASQFGLDQSNSVQNYLDPYCVQILNITRENFKSATEISANSSLSLTTVYRRIHLLQECGLLEVIGKIRSDGRKFFLYKSKVRELS